MASLAKNDYEGKRSSGQLAIDKLFARWNDLPECGEPIMPVYWHELIEIRDQVYLLMRLKDMFK